MTNTAPLNSWLDKIKEITANFLLEHHLEQVYLALKKLEYGLVINNRAAIARRLEGSTEVASSFYRILKPWSGTPAKTVLFVTYHPQGFISDHVKNYLRHWKLAGCSVILIKVVDDMNDPSANTITAEADAAMVRRNKGYDFGAWAHALRLFPEVYQGTVLYFINDSVFGPLDTQLFLKLITQVEGTDADMVALTQCYQNLHHYQSYFLAFRNLSKNSSKIKGYWDKVRNLKSKQAVVFEYEHGLMHYFLNLDLKCHAIFPILKGVSNPSIGGWKKLLDLGYPFVKVALFNRHSDFAMKHQCREVIENTGYNMSWIDQHIEALRGKN